MFLEALINDGGVWVPPTDTPCRVHPDAWSDSLMLRDGYSRQAAQRVCKTECHLRQECLNTAMEAERGLAGFERCGIRGGLTAYERQKLERESRSKRKIR